MADILYRSRCLDLPGRAECFLLNAVDFEVVGDGTVEEDRQVGKEDLEIAVVISEEDVEFVDAELQQDDEHYPSFHARVSLGDLIDSWIRSEIVTEDGRLYDDAEVGAEAALRALANASSRLREAFEAAKAKTDVPRETGKVRNR